MAQNADQPLIAALDIGSSKVSAMIARTDDEGRLTVLGTGQRAVPCDLGDHHRRDPGVRERPEDVVEAAA